MATRETLTDQCERKLTAPDGVLHRNGVFLFPASKVADWYRSSGIESTFRGLAVRTDAELHIDMISVTWDYQMYDISVYLEPAKGGSKFAHRLNIRPVGGTTLTADGGFMRNLWNAARKVEASERDIDAFSGFINSADDYNVLLPETLYPGLYHPQTPPYNGLIIPGSPVMV